MAKKLLSPLGYIMEALNIQNVNMSRSIHVDSTLISKWRTGNRVLTKKSIYFEDVVDFIMDQSVNTLHENLKTALCELYPNCDPQNEHEIEALLIHALSNNHKSSNSLENQFLHQDSNSVSSLVYSKNTGRRSAISKLLDFAESMTTSGEFIVYDNEEFCWLFEDEEYVHQFVARIEALVQNDFHAIFVINYSSYKDRLVKLFDKCSPLLFNPNIEWYCNEHFDECLINFSFFILNHAISIMGLSSDLSNQSTILFTNPNIVMTHELMVRDSLTKCHKLFENFELSNINDILYDVSQFRRRGVLYAYLPSPVFLFTNETLLLEILKNNHVNQKNIDTCLSLNRKITGTVSKHLFKHCSNKENSLIYIFQLEQLVEHASESNFTSNSLSIVCGHPVTITPAQYLQQLRTLADLLLENNNISIFLVSDQDNISLPKINCWCKNNTWMIQMNKKELRLSNDYTIVSAASKKWTQCIRSIPSERKDRPSVHSFLTMLADNLERKLDRVL